MGVYRESEKEMRDGTRMEKGRGWREGRRGGREGEGRARAREKVQRYSLREIKVG